MDHLLKQIWLLKKSGLKKVIDSRIKEFENNDNWFSELSFCLLTANFQAKRSIKIQAELKDQFLTIQEKELASKLRSLGHRFPNTRARYIVLAQQKYPQLLKIISRLSDADAREWLVKNIKGLGYKESSHFLRNIGRKDIAIIDFHIIDILTRHNILDHVAKPLTKTKYLLIESKLRPIADKLELNLAELDLYLWYLETKTVLK